MITASISKVETLWGAMRVRSVRNHPEIRRFMTGNTERVGILQQIVWWFFRDENLDLYLVTPIEYDVEIGYGLVKTEMGTSWLTGAILPKWQGNGFGRQLFEHLIEKAEPKAYIETMLAVRKNNVKAHALYSSLGFVEEERDGDTITMRLRK